MHLLLALLLGGSALAQDVVRDPALGPVAPRESFVDEGERFEVERLGGGRVRIRGPRGAYHATISDHAIVELGPRGATSLAELGVEVVRPLMPRAGLYLIASQRGEDGVALAARLSSAVAQGTLRAVFPDLAIARARYEINVPPDDPTYDSQWYFQRIHLEDAWRIETGDPATEIAVNDDGCDLMHPDLAAHIEPGLDVVDMDDDPSSPPAESHGTSCAGIVAAVGDNGEGIAGACPECHLRCVRLLSDEPTLISSDVDAFEFAIEQDVAVVSNSWGFVERTDVPGPLRTAIEKVFADGRDGKGALVVFAAGNDNRELGDEELTNVDGVITVGALNNFDEATSFSNRGPSVDIAAPTGTITTDPTGANGAEDGDYTTHFGGTSSACPVVAGVAALLFSAKPEATAAEVSDVLIATARPAPFGTPDENGHDALYGFGVVDPAAALRMLLGLPEPEPDAGPTEDASTPDAMTSPGDDDDDCGCRLAGRADRDRSGLALCALIAAAALVRAISRRR